MCTLLFISLFVLIFIISFFLLNKVLKKKEYFEDTIDSLQYEKSLLHKRLKEYELIILQKRLKNLPTTFTDEELKLLRYLLHPDKNQGKDSCNSLFIKVSSLIDQGNTS